MKRVGLYCRAVASAGLMLSCAASAAGAGLTEVVTRPPVPGPSLLVPGYRVAISANGRYVAFAWTAPNLVDGDTNEVSDAFVYDRETGLTEMISRDSSGRQGDRSSWFPSISDDGRSAAFASNASNLVPGDGNRASDVFVRDRNLGATSRVSVASGGAEANGESYYPVISSDGRVVAFFSEASNLVPGDTNRSGDVFVHDRQSGLTSRVSVDSFGIQASGPSSSPAISSDGRYLAFVSVAANLVIGDANQSSDVFLRDRLTGTTELISTDSLGEQGNAASDFPSISGDGRFVAFWSSASNLVPGDTNDAGDVFVHDRKTGATTRVSVDSVGAEANFGGDRSAISSDGRFVAFESIATNLVPLDTNGRPDLFVHDRHTGETTRVSVDSAGAQGNGWSLSPAISSDGRYVAFESYASNLAAEDSDAQLDIFVHDRGTGPCVRSATTACLQESRFEATVSYRTTTTGGAAELMTFAGVRAESVDSAFYWFFAATNFEMGLKVLDACRPELGDKFWVFVSGLTDQGWTVRVRDTWTGRMQRYANPVGTLSATFRDPLTFDCAAGGARATEADDPARARAIVERETEPDASADLVWLPPSAMTEICERNATTACLQGGRFRVRADWRTTTGSGVGEVMGFAGVRTENVDSVFFTFFGPSNFELGLKVLDACRLDLGNKFWVFLSGLTDQGWNVSVEDLLVGRRRTYGNPVGTLSTTYRDSTSFDCE